MRTFRHLPQRRQIHQHRNALRAKHRAPHHSRRRRQPTRHAVVGDVRYHYPQHDAELVHQHKTASALWRRNLSDVHRHRHRNAAYRNAADESHPPEHMRPGNPAWRERAPCRRHEEQHSHPDERRLASEPVAHPPRRQRTEHRADQRAGHHQPMPERRERELPLYRLRAPRDHPGVEPEQQPSKRNRPRYPIQRLHLPLLHFTFLGGRAYAHASRSPPTNPRCSRTVRPGNAWRIRTADCTPPPR